MSLCTTNASPAVSHAGVSRNTILNMAGQVTAAVSALICMPYFVHALGPARVGILSIIWVIVGYFSFLDLGLGRAVTNAVSGSIAKQHYNEIPTLFWSATRIQFLTGFAGTILAVATLPYLIHHFFRVSPSLIHESLLAGGISAVSLPVVLLSSSTVGLLQAARRFDLCNAIQIPASISNYVLPMIGALIWHQLPPIVGIIVTVRALSLIALLWQANIVFPGLLHASRFDKDCFRKLFRFGGWISVSSILSPLLTNGDRFLIGAFIGMPAVAYYSVPSDALSRLTILPASLVVALFPVFSSHSSGDSQGSIGDLAARSMRLTLCVLGIPLMVFACLAPWLMTIWMGTTFSMHSAAIVRIVSFGVLLNGLAFIPFSLLQALGRPDITAKLHAVEVPMHLTILILSLKCWGISGAAIAWTIRVSFDAIVLILLSIHFQFITKKGLCSQHVISAL